MSVVSNRELLWNFTLRELRTKYRRSFLGWTWSMLNPLATLAIYWFVFGVVFDATAPIGDPSGLGGFISEAIDATQFGATSGRWSTLRLG